MPKDLFSKLLIAWAMGQGLADKTAA